MPRTQKLMKNMKAEAARAPYARFWSSAPAGLVRVCNTAPENVIRPDTLQMERKVLSNRVFVGSEKILSIA
jgi:hypothetical protein